MGYHKDLAITCQWLASIQRPDHGWGLAPGQASSLVNTAEAVYVLTRASGYDTLIRKGLGFIESNVFKHIEQNGPRIRYVAFSLAAMAEHPNLVSSELFERCCKWLEDTRNTDNGWGAEAGQDSELFPTCLSIWALQKARWPESKLDPSLQWLLSRAHNAGWALDSAQGLSPVATAYALVCLAQSDYREHDRVRAGKEYLLQTRHWGMEEEVTSGTVWKHCTYAWVIPALLALDENPYSTTIAEGVRYINSLKSRHGGWNETENDKGRTVRAQFWSTLALDSIFRSFDPGIHVLRIDAERAEQVLSEPEHVKIAVHKKWATIIPASAYKFLAYLFLILVPMFLFGIYRRVEAIPTRADALLALAALAASWFLMQKRQRYFPKGIKAFRWALAIFSVASAIFGIDAESAAIKIKSIVAGVRGLILP